MKIKLYQVDAFTDVLFGGNPAGVCPLESWLDDKLMQKIASENNLSETAFFVPTGDSFELRWFTPATEVDLCGHATLGTSYVIFNYLNHKTDTLRFKTRSGDLIVTKNNELLTLDFPAVTAERCDANELLTQIFQASDLEVWKGTDYMVVLSDENAVRKFQPNLPLIEQLKARGLVITAKGDQADFVSRWFGPQVGVPEDPVTGSAHCMLAPYWAEKLGKTKLYAEQLSARLGKIHCEIRKDRVLLTGQVMPYLCGEIEVG